MNLSVTEEIAKWYKEELEIQTPAYIRFFPRYGFGGHIPGFSIGINQDPPQDIHAKTEVGDIIFFIEHEDAWYFNNIDLKVAYNEKLQEPQYSYGS